jgi:hypothetical protein
MYCFWRKDITTTIATGEPFESMIPDWDGPYLGFIDRQKTQTIDELRQCCIDTYGTDNEMVTIFDDAGNEIGWDFTIASAIFDMTSMTFSEPEYVQLIKCRIVEMPDDYLSANDKNYAELCHKLKGELV